jgi:hypothetical protein
VNPTACKKGISLFSFHDPDFFVCQSIQFVNEMINLIIGGVDLALEDSFVGSCFNSAGSF